MCELIRNKCWACGAESVRQREWQFVAWAGHLTQSCGHRSRTPSERAYYYYSFICHWKCTQRLKVAASVAAACCCCDCGARVFAYEQKIARTHKHDWHAVDGWRRFDCVALRSQLAQAQTSIEWHLSIRCLARSHCGCLCFSHLANDARERTFNCRSVVAAMCNLTWHRVSTHTHTRRCIAPIAHARALPHENRVAYSPKLAKKKQYRYVRRRHRRHSDGARARGHARGLKTSRNRKTERHKQLIEHTF